MANALSISDLSLRVAGKLLLNNANIIIPAGSKCGFVGRNGCGKSSLFKAITDQTYIENGTISVPKDHRLGQVAQEAPDTDDSLTDIVLAADKERLNLLAAAEKESDGLKLADIHARLDDIDAHAAPARAAQILAGLGFGHDAQAKPVSSFSGGWRMRVALASVLFSQPDLLLLDEPTNYLDLEGTLWLQNYIARYPGTVIIISHDRALLNASANRIIHFHGEKLTAYSGNFDQFQRQRAQAQALAEKSAAKQQARINHMMGFVDRFRYKASKAKQAQSRLRAIEKMAPITAMQDQSVADIRFGSPERKAASPILKLGNVSCGYGADHPILSKLNLRIDGDDRIALLGPNGNGKSTFAKLLCDRLPHVQGEIVRADKLKIALFAQHQMDDLTANETPVQHIGRLYPSEVEAKHRAKAAAMGLGGESMDTPAKHLSGGEKARLLLGLIGLQNPNLLILDEPTNHLDMESRQALADGLNRFDGAVIIIAHDKSLLETCADRLWIVSGGTVGIYDGDLDSYSREIIAQRGSGSAPASTSSSQSKVSQRKIAAQKRADLAPARKQLEEVETKIEKLNKALAKLDRELSEPGLYEKTPNKAAQMSKFRTKLTNELSSLEEIWLELAEQVQT